jgi:hypothetical protein
MDGIENERKEIRVISDKLKMGLTEKFDNSFIGKIMGEDIFPRSYEYLKRYEKVNVKLMLKDFVENTPYIISFSVLAAAILE